MAVIRDSIFFAWGIAMIGRTVITKDFGLLFWTAILITAIGLENILKYIRRDDEK